MPAPNKWIGTETKIKRGWKRDKETDESYFTSEEGTHHTNGKTCHTEGFGQGVLGAQMGQQLYGEDLWQKKQNCH